jgi:3-oxoacyl-[acyl-carrier protein] reductase
MTSRRVLVTGASKGIGRAVTDLMASRGYEPIGIARTAPADFPGRFYEVNLPDPAATAATLERILAGGRVDAVVNNAGLARMGVIGSLQLQDLFDTYDLNVRAAVQVLQAVLPGMRAAQWGRIINVTSLTTLGASERTP